MGEYWKPVNVTRGECIHAHDVNEGLKLAEWTWPGSAVLALMASWSPEDDVRIVSDYEGDIRVTEAAKVATTEMTYEAACDLRQLKSAPEIVPPQPSPVAALVVKAAAPRIPYEAWHATWRVEED